MHFKPTERFATFAERLNGLPKIGRLLLLLTMWLLLALVFCRRNVARALTVSPLPFVISFSSWLVESFMLTLKRRLVATFRLGVVCELPGPRCWWAGAVNSTKRNHIMTTVPEEWPARKTTPQKWKWPRQKKRR